jgi:integrase
LADGIDPIEAKRADRAARALAESKAITFAEAAQAFFDQHEKKWRNTKHRAQFLSTLKAYAYPKIGRLAVADIDTGQVLKVIEPIWATKTETANRVRGRIEQVLDWCTVRGYRVGDNPARWRGHLLNVLPPRGAVQKVKHHAALPFSEIGEFMAALKKREGTTAAALRFTILTSARSGEVIGAKWDEIDLATKVWTIPESRMKGGKAHRAPLSEAALQLLKDLPREADNEFIFVGPRPKHGLSNAAMSAVLDRMGRGDITVHGFRSSFRDWAAECTSYPNHIVEMALAHSIGNKAEAAYRRGDLLTKRRQLSEAWAKYCETPKREAGVVIPIRGGA